MATLDEMLPLYTVETAHDALLRAAENAGQIAMGACIEQGLEDRDYQKEAWSALYESRGEGQDAALLHMATGLGKTTIAAIDTLRFTDQFIYKNNRIPRILFAAHQTSILEQASSTFMHFAPSLMQGRFDGHKKDLDKDIIFGTMQSLYKNLDAIKSDQFDYIIYDEAHHAQADTFKASVEHFHPSFRLALTATPDRMDQKRIEDLFGEPVYSKTIAEAMYEGLLADVDYHIVIDDAVKRAIESDFSPKNLGEIRSLLMNTSRNHEIAAQIKSETERIKLEDAKTIVFCQTLEQADEMAKLLGGKPYHSGHENDNAQTLQDFRTGKTRVITVRDMLNEGVDIPDARLLVLLRATGSKTIFEQQLGRGLRKTREKDTTSVLDFVGNIERLEQIQMLVDTIKLISETNRSKNGKDGRSTGGMSIHTQHSDFDFDKISVQLLEKISHIKSSWSHISTIEDAAELWKSNFGTTRPTVKSIEEAVKDGSFMSVMVLRKFGGISALQGALGVEVDSRYRWQQIETIEDLKTEYLKVVGEGVRPDIEMIRQLSKEGRFPSVNTIRRHFGGLGALQKSLGFELSKSSRERWQHIETLEDLRAEYLMVVGEGVRPDVNLIKQLAKEGKFPTNSTIVTNFGGLSALQKSLGFKPDPRQESSWENITDIDDLKSEYIRVVGEDVRPTDKLLKQLAKEGKLPPRSVIVKLGGLGELQESLGFEKSPVYKWKDMKSVEDLKAEYIKVAGADTRPTRDLLEQLSKDGKFPSNTIINKFGGMGALRRELGFDS